jgi:peptidoglycan/LPS O-acetylase OafA/YrhL
MAKILNLKYLITIEDSTKKILLFLNNRIARIFPLFYFTVFISSWFFFPDTFIFYTKDGLRKIYLLFTMQYYPFQFDYNGVVWSLGPEVLFYVLSPFLTLIIFKVLKKNVLANSILLILSLVLLSTNYILNGYLLLLSKLGILFLMDKRLPGIELFLKQLPIFLVGYFGFYIIKYTLEKLKDFQLTSVTSRLRIISIFIILYLLMSLEWLKFDTRFNFVIFGIVTLIFILLIEIADFYTFKKPNNIFNHLGNLSYGIYLIHILLIIRFNQTYFPFLRLHFSNQISGFIVLVCVTVLSIIIAHFLYYAVELPGGKFVKNLMKEKI